MRIISGYLKGKKINLPKNKKTRPLKDLEKLEAKKSSEEFIFHAGTKIVNKKIFSNGGRVLNFVKQSKNFKKSRDELIILLDELNWENGFFRRDIGHKVIDI